MVKAFPMVELKIALQQTRPSRVGQKMYCQHPLKAMLCMNLRAAVRARMLARHHNVWRKGPSSIISSSLLFPDYAKKSVLDYSGLGRQN